MRLLLFIGILAACAGPAGANGGPFLVQYPNGDPAAKGVVAPLDRRLMPGRETRLRVRKEELQLTFEEDGFSSRYGYDRPLVKVSAAYTIQNPTEKPVEVEFGFPILRGGEDSAGALGGRGWKEVRLGQKPLPSFLITGSLLYGCIRQRARGVIEKGIAADRELAKRVAAVRKGGPGYEAARAALSEYAAGKLKWNRRDAALLVEYASLNLPRGSQPAGDPFGASPQNTRFWQEMDRLRWANLGDLAAIGEQKATQFLAQLASRLGKDSAGLATSYEAVFKAWGGDVRERSVDLTTGLVRPREMTVAAPAAGRDDGAVDPTIYARQDYLDPRRPLPPRAKASCLAILKNLPVVFTFAPMSILCYQATFPKGSKQTLTVSYQQYAYRDTRAPASYQMAYVLHPASFWKEFGPIHLTVRVPAGVHVAASVPCRQSGGESYDPWPGAAVHLQRAVYAGTLTKKTGEIFLAVDAAQWRKAWDDAARARRATHAAQPPGGAGQAAQAPARQQGDGR